MSNCVPAIEIGEADPRQVAVRLFGPCKPAASNLDWNETPRGLDLTCQGIPVWVVAVGLGLFVVLTGLVVWNTSQSAAAFLSTLAVVGVSAAALLRTCDAPMKGPDILVSYDAYAGRILADSGESIEARQIECVYDARGWDQDKSGGYRQATALVRDGNKRVLHRLFHQSAERYISDDLVESLARQLNVPCHVIEDVVFEGA